MAFRAVSATAARRAQRVLLAPWLAPGNVDELDGGPIGEPFDDGDGVLALPEALPAPGVLVLVLGVVTGVAVTGGFSGGGVAVDEVELLALGGGGPASGRFAAGGILVLVGSAIGPLLVVPPG